MSRNNGTQVFENEGIRIIQKPSREIEGHYEYHVYALDVDDFKNESWRWIGKSGVNQFSERYAQRSRNGS